MNCLKKIRIQGFKSIVDQEIEPGQVNVLIGANGSGKTAMLEAIGMLSAAISGYVDDESLERRGVRLGIPQLYKSSFKDFKADHISLSIDSGNSDEMWHYSVELANPNENPERAWIYQHERLNLNNQLVLQHTKNKVDIYGAGEIKLQINEADKTFEGANTTFSMAVSQTETASGNVFLELLRQLKSYAIYAPSTPMLCDVVTDTRTHATRFPLGLSGNRLAQAMQPLIDVENETYGHLDLDEVLDLLDWIDSIAVVSPNTDILSPSVSRLQKVLRFTDFLMGKDNNRFTAYDASEGSLYVFFLLTLAMHPEAPRIFAVENFDQALNPRLARALANSFCQAIFGNPRQPMVFLTTHNPLVLDGIDILDDGVRLFAIDRDSTGYTTINRVFVTEELLKKGEQGLTLSDLWVMGLLGGVSRL
jgi:predicted ATPase